MASSSAAWVFGVARLISSASSTLVNSGPGRNSNSPRSGRHSEMPITSEGSVSAVNWMRAKLRSNERARAWARVVLPTPGMSSINTWPRASSAATMSSMASALPWITRATERFNSPSFALASRPSSALISPPFIRRTPARTPP